MEAPVLDTLRPRIQLVHGWVLNAVVALTTEQLAQRHSPTSPPVGWHLWHITRWSDRLQASFDPRGDGNSNEPADPNRDFWHIEGMAAKWKLDPAKLGILETGTGMAQDDAAALAAQIDKIALLDYAQRTLAAVEKALAPLTDNKLTVARASIREFRLEEKTLVQAAGEQTTHLGDILYHLTHTSRHLGMMEGLRGLLGMEGTVTA